MRKISLIRKQNTRRPSCFGRGLLSSDVTNIESTQSDQSNDFGGKFEFEINILVKKITDSCCYLAKKQLDGTLFARCVMQKVSNISK